VLETVHSNEHLPAAERYEWFCDLLSRKFLPSAVSSSEAHDFRASAKHLDMGVARVGVLEYPALRARRTPRMVRGEDLDMYWLLMNARGRQGVSSDRREVTLAAGELVLLDARRPFDAWSRPTTARTELITVALPRGTMPLPRATLDRLVLTGLGGGTGMGALLTSFLRRLVSESRSYGPQDAVRLGTVLADLVVAVLAHHGVTEKAVPAETRRQTLLTGIHSFIERHLGTWQLSPATIAAAHHISVRHLHRIFQEQGTTVGTWIRHRRLERCRRDLLAPPCPEPTVQELTVQAIGARWGFRNASEFSRAFSAAYGMPPGEYRRRAEGLIARSGTASTRRRAAPGGTKSVRPTPS
jgi:AraC-like DNA-binding protein